MRSATADRYERIVSRETLCRAIEAERRERLAYEAAIRLGRAGKGPHPFLAGSYAVTTAAQRELQRVAEIPSVPNVVPIKRTRSGTDQR